METKRHILAALILLFTVHCQGQLISDPDAVQAAYEDVRSDSSETNWASLTYDGNVLSELNTGTDYADLLAEMQDDVRLFAYARFESGTAGSRRVKFAFLTWIGPAVSPLKKAKVSTDKAFVKKIWVDFSKEILADEKKDVEEGKVQAALDAASGAAYGTGK